MTGSVAVRLAYKAIAMGARIPTAKRWRDFEQQGRTIDEIKRRAVDLVLDVGANRGFYAKHLRMLGYTGLIFSFEPDPGTFAALQAMAQGDDRWRLFNCALGAIEGEIEFNVIDTGGETVLSSALKPLGDLPVTSTRVPVRTVAGVLRSEKVPADARIFLKMDTQGYDLEVFSGLGDVRPVLLQSEVSVVPLYAGMPSYTRSLQEFEQGGFELVDLFIVRRTESGAILEYDALMGRRASRDGHTA